MTRLATAAALALALTALASGPVAACRCSNIGEAEAFAAADVSFEGVVLAVKEQNGDPDADGRLHDPPPET